MKGREDQQEWAKAWGAHGLRGGVTLRPFPAYGNTPPKPGERVLLLPESQDSALPAEGLETSVTKVILGHKTMAFFEGIDSRNKAQDLLPFRLMLLGKEAPPSLLGLRAVDTEGAPLGVVVHLFHNGVQEVVEIEGPCPMALPLVPSFVKGIDLKAGLITLERPEYL